MVDLRRSRILKEGSSRGETVVYWMSRDQRVNDNWSLLHAQEVAKKRKSPLAVVFCLAPDFLGATIRHYAFMLKGLSEVESALRKKNITFHLLAGNPGVVLPRFLERHRVGYVVADFSPLSVNREWKRALVRKTDATIIEVDAHNIVPCWSASDKQEYGAYTIRPKIHRALPEFLTDFPKLAKHPFKWERDVSRVDWRGIRSQLGIDTSVGEMGWIEPGEQAAHRMLKKFRETRLRRYDEGRNDPNEAAQSNLSPYLHFGQISAQRIALEVKKAKAPKNCRDAFLEELIVRRELSDNFCFYNPSYDQFEGFPAWAQKTLNEHRNDRREFVYSLEQFESAETHDPLWNAAQREMVTTGKMHGYLRMYWAKKILEWSKSPDEALAMGIFLNDRYELDGRDPNGYVGVAWSVGGVHDRAWTERPVFGKIRYMNFNGCRRKFDVEKYIARFRD